MTDEKLKFLRTADPHAREVRKDNTPVASIQWHRTRESPRIVFYGHNPAVTLDDIQCMVDRLRFFSGE